MKLFIPALTLYAIACCAAAELHADVPEGMRLVWSDEFDADGRPDPEKWGYERGFVRNRELQWYQPENAFCEDGMLVIEGRRERKDLSDEPRRLRRRERQRPFAEYTAASVTTRGKFEWRHGLLEVRAKVIAADGLWPAIWTLGVKNGWPANGEVDVMEYYRGDILANAAWRGENGRTAWDSSHTPVRDLGKDWDAEFHVWRMDWDADRIVLSVDDRVLNTIETTKADGTTQPHPFQQPHYLLLNLAIGGTNGGDPSKTQFPSRYLIDYVRVYQRSE
ncbi:Beta-glucanase precursor [Posidoniimonas corsicana]|uniref:Beta-glucanase n=1 Tax=Posidoniimonas corsicana TaxID=1938618 RepID=A0A5C5VI87_9BACT|nr:glycoside hydrolase family 16 protein [Posidoniimonas corsicana]TWT38278.1 Beta-glucanase precursor [Posidoniimonas corsicana]